MLSAFLCNSSNLDSLVVFNLLSLRDATRGRRGFKSRRSTAGGASQSVLFPGLSVNGASSFAWERFFQSWRPIPPPPDCSDPDVCLNGWSRAPRPADVSAAGFIVWLFNKSQGNVEQSETGAGGFILAAGGQQTHTNAARRRRLRPLTTFKSRNASFMGEFLLGSAALFPPRVCLLH